MTAKILPLFSKGVAPQQDISEMSCVSCGVKLEGVKVYHVETTGAYACEECTEISARMVLMLAAELHLGKPI